MNKLIQFVQRYKISILASVLGGLLFFAISMPFFCKYRANAEIIVIQKQNNWKIDDAYASAKSAERVSYILAHAIKTTSFMDRVMASGYDLDTNLLNHDLQDKKQIWDSMISVKTINNSGIIELSVLHKDKNQAKQFANAISFILANKADQYHGGGSRIVTKLIDGPIVSSGSMRSIIWIDALLGAILGLAIGLAIDHEKQDKGQNNNRFNFKTKYYPAPPDNLPR
ncbi:hypothetical protein D4R87_02185 [bacterium]|nr:MAG: hypothetical protein D4R87_02185 [bacterium]